MKKLKLMWLCPSVVFVKSPEYTEVWQRYMLRRGWEFTPDPDEADLIFFSSDSVLDEKLVGLDKAKLAYFWGFLHERLLEPAFQSFAQAKVQLFKQCTMTLVPSMVTYYQACDLGLPTRLCLPGIDINLYDSAPEQKRVNQVMFISRLAPYKRLDMVIKAVAAVDPKIKLLVAGPGDEKPYRRLADYLGVDMQTGELTDEEKAIELKRSAVLVHPTEYGCYSTPPFEALWCRTPVILSDIPVHRWLFANAALYANNEDELAQGIISILKYPQSATKIAEAGRKLTEENFTFDLACRRLESFIQATIRLHSAKKIKEAKTQADWEAAYDLKHKGNWDFSVCNFDPTWAKHWRAQYFINALKECNAEHILDVGSGAVYPTIFAKAGFKVCAADISPEALSQVKEIATKWGVADKIEAMKQDAANLDKCATEGFDAVVQAELWEHVPDPQKVIAEGMRVLKPGGYLISSTPVAGHHFDPTHLRAFNDQGIQELLKPWANHIKKMEKVGEGSDEPSSYVIVIEKEKSSAKEI